MIAVVDYRMGNLRSVCNALGRLGAEYKVTSSAKEIASADKVLLPGVGNASEAMNNIREEGLADVIRTLRKPVLGICIGMQVLCRYSEEGNTQCLGLFDTDVRRFQSDGDMKIPHMGWNTIANLDSKLFKDIAENTFVYFVHSYRPGLCSDTIATTRYGSMFSSALKYENFYGTQFHPEKSGEAGEAILKNFLRL